MCRIVSDSFPHLLHIHTLLLLLLLLSLLSSLLLLLLLLLFNLEHLSRARAYQYVKKEVITLLFSSNLLSKTCGQYPCRPFLFSSCVSLKFKLSTANAWPNKGAFSSVPIIVGTQIEGYLELFTENIYFYS